MRLFRHFIEYAGLLIAFGIWRTIPFSWALKLADSLAPALAFLFPVRKSVVLRNLNTAFPDLNAKKRKKLLSEIYRNFFLLIIEFIHFRNKDSQDATSQIAEIEGAEYFEQVGAGGKPFLAITAHIGNWELMGAWFAARGVPLSVLAKPIHNPHVDKMINKMRKQRGMEVISTRGEPIREVLAALKRGRCVAFLADQDARKAGIFVDFFGKPASTFTGPALFAIRSGLPILPAFDIRTGLATHKVVFLPPIYPPSKEEDRESAIQKLTQIHTRILEDIIRQYPEQYFWFHRRWKSRPPAQKNKKIKIVS